MRRLFFVINLFLLSWISFAKDEKLNSWFITLDELSSVLPKISNSEEVFSEKNNSNTSFLSSEPVESNSAELFEHFLEENNQESSDETMLP